MADHIERLIGQIEGETSRLLAELRFTNKALTAMGAEPVSAAEFQRVVDRLNPEDVSCWLDLSLRLAWQARKAADAERK